MPEVGPVPTLPSGASPSVPSTPPPSIIAGQLPTAPSTRHSPCALHAKPSGHALAAPQVSSQSLNVTPYEQAAPARCATTTRAARLAGFVAYGTTAMPPGSNEAVVIVRTVPAARLAPLPVVGT